MNSSIVRRSVALALAGGMLGLTTAEVHAQQVQRAASGVLEEITVTARRRDESLQEVPVAATAFSVADLDRQIASGLEDLHLAVPNMTITRNNTGSNGAQVYIRGIGRDNSTWNEESGVAIYVDDVYMSQQIGSLLDFIEYERIEVLRGPQGTLYGRNATSGAVKFVVRRPSFEGFSAVGDVTLGKFGRLDMRGSANLELVDDRLAVKLDFVSRNDDGYVRRPASSTIAPGERLNGLNRQTGRLAALFRATDATEIYLTADITYGRDDVNTPIPLGFGGVTRFGSNFVGDPDVRNDLRFTGRTFTAHVTTDFDGVTFKSVTAYRSIEDQLFGDLWGGISPLGFSLAFEQQTDFDTFTQEFQFAGQFGERLDYVAGLFYLREDLEADALNRFLGNIRTLSEQRTTSLAAYLDMSYSLTDTLSASVGGRYTRDKKDVTQSAILPTGVALFENASAEQTWSEFSPRIGLDWQASDAALLYASWARGFKAGAVANGRPTAPDVATTFTAPETATTIEVGVKSQWFDNRLRVNLAVFDTDYKNQQASFRETDTNIIRVVSADAEIRGVELEAVARVTEALTIYLTAGWLDSKYTSVQPGHPVANLPQSVQLKQIPERAYRIGAQYRIPLRVWSSDLVLDANYLDSAEIPRDIANNPLVTTPSYSTLDAQIALESQDGRWRVALSGKNLTAEEYWTMGTNPFSRFYAPERVWALNLRYAIN